MPTECEHHGGPVCGLFNQNKFIMYALFVSREGDHKAIQEDLERFRTFGDQELVDAYNREAQIGIVGVHQQQLCLIALREVMRERFNHSPIFFESGVIGMQGEVRLVESKVWFK